MKALKSIIHRTNKKIFIESLILFGVLCIITFMVLHVMQYGFVYTVNP